MDVSGSLLEKCASDSVSMDSGWGVYCDKLATSLKWARQGPEGENEKGPVGGAHAQALCGLCSMAVVQMLCGNADGDTGGCQLKGWRQQNCMWTGTRAGAKARGAARLRRLTACPVASEVVSLTQATALCSLRAPTG